MIGIKIVFISFFVSYGTTITIDDDADRTTVVLYIVVFKLLNMQCFSVRLLSLKDTRVKFIELQLLMDTN